MYCRQLYLYLYYSIVLCLDAECCRSGLADGKRADSSMGVSDRTVVRACNGLVRLTDHVQRTGHLQHSLINGQTITRHWFAGSRWQSLTIGIHHPQ